MPNDESKKSTAKKDSAAKTSAKKPSSSRGRKTDSVKKSGDTPVVAQKAHSSSRGPSSRNQGAKSMPGAKAEHRDATVGGAKSMPGIKADRTDSAVGGAKSMPAFQTKAPKDPKGHVKSALNFRKLIPIAVLVLVLLGLAIWFIIPKEKGKVLFTYKDAAGKSMSVTVGEAIKEVTPLLRQAPQEAVDALQEGVEGVRGVINSVSVQPRLFLIESLQISNFQDSPDYQAQLSNELGLIPYQIAFNKSVTAINKAVDAEKVNVAEISRIFLKKSGVAAADEANLAVAQQLLADLKAVTNTNLAEEFGKMAAEKSQEPIGAQSGGYFGSVTKGQYPTIDPFIFDKKAPEGLYGEIINAPEAYYLVYVHSPARNITVKEYGDENPQARNMMITSNVIKNTEILFTYENGIIKMDGKDIKPEELSDTAPLAKYWGKTYKAAELATNLAAISGPGVRMPSAAELAQLISKPDSMYSIRLAVLAKTPVAGVLKTKEYTDATNTLTKGLDNQAVGMVIQNYLSSRVDTNVTPTDIANYYNSAAQKPVKGYDTNGQPIYATLRESMEALKGEVLNSRNQQEFAKLENEIAAKYELTWKDENLEAYKKVFNAEYAKLTKKPQ